MVIAVIAPKFRFLCVLLETVQTSHGAVNSERLYNWPICYEYTNNTAT